MCDEAARIVISDGDGKSNSVMLVLRQAGMMVVQMWWYVRTKRSFLSSKLPHSVFTPCEQ
jgi:hypothetical protein